MTEDQLIIEMTKIISPWKEGMDVLKSMHWTIRRDGVVHVYAVWGNLQISDSGCGKMIRHRTLEECPPQELLDHLEMVMDFVTTRKNMTGPTMSL